MLFYLTSSASVVIDKLIPYLPKSPAEMTVAFIPTAGDIYQDKPWQEADKAALVRLGFQLEIIDIKDEDMDSLKQKLESKDIIFVAGGSTTYLLEKAQQSGFLEVVRTLVANGLIYIGSSAGSLLAGPNIEVDKIFDSGEYGKTLDNYQALGLVDFVILPHADDMTNHKFIEKIHHEYDNKYILKELNDNQAFLIIDKEIQLIEV